MKKRKTTVRKHKRKKPTGGYTTVREHQRQLGLDRFATIEADIEEDLEEMESLDLEEKEKKEYKEIDISHKNPPPIYLEFEKFPPIHSGLRNFIHAFRKEIQEKGRPLTTMEVDYLTNLHFNKDLDESEVMQNLTERGFIKEADDTYQLGRKGTAYFDIIDFFYPEILYQVAKRIQGNKSWRDLTALPKTHFFHLVKDLGFHPDDAYHILRDLSHKGYLNYEDEWVDLKVYGEYRAADRFDLNKLTLKTLKGLAEYAYLSDDTPERGYWHKQELINALRDDNIPWNVIENYIHLLNSSNSLTKQERLVYYYLSKNGLSREYAERMFGPESIKKLLNKNLLFENEAGWLQMGIRETPSPRILDKYFHVFDDLEVIAKHIDPLERTMEKRAPHSVIDASKALARNEEDREYSLYLDFERELESPERFVALKGGANMTFKGGEEDFEMFGHTHPTENNPVPSSADLINLKYGAPEFLIGSNGDAIIMEIENYPRYKSFNDNALIKASTLEMALALTEDLYDNFDEDAEIYWGQWFTSEGDSKQKYRWEDKTFQKRFQERTGIKIIPYQKGMTVKLIDDPTIKEEKMVPTFDLVQMRKINKNIDEWRNMRE